MDSIFQYVIELILEWKHVLITLFIANAICVFIAVRRSKQQQHALQNEFKRRQGINGRGDASQENRKFTACSSAECVRCQKYHSTSTTAMERLYAYSKLNDTSEINRIVDTIGEMQLVQPTFASELQKPNVFYLPSLTAQPFWEETPDTIGESVARLESCFDDIYDEFCNAYENISDPDSGGWKSNTSDGGSWHIFSFYNQGYKVFENCERCPKTTDIVGNLRGVMTDCLFGNVLFSVLYPGTVVTEHFGPTNIRLRTHLGIYN